MVLVRGAVVDMQAGVVAAQAPVSADLVSRADSPCGEVPLPHNPFSMACKAEITGATVKVEADKAPDKAAQVAAPRSHAGGLARLASSRELGSSQTPTKRGRVTNKSSGAANPLIDLPDSPAVKSEIQSSDPGADEAVDVCRDYDPNMPCHGCLRCMAKHYSFLFAGQPFEMAYVTKSQQWCKDCHTLWRTLYKSRLTLTLFFRYLELWPNRLEWFGELIAFLSLRQEGSKVIRSEHIKARVTSLQFVFSMLNLPFPMFEVKACKPADLTADDITTGHFTVMTSADGRREMVRLVSIDSSLRKLADLSPARVAMDCSRQQKLMHTLCCSDADALQSRGGATDAIIKTDSREQDADASSSTAAATSDENKDNNTWQITGVPDSVALVGRVNGCKDRIMMTLQDFALDECVQMREKPLTTCLNHALGVQHACASSPYATELLPHVDLLVQAVDAAKKLLRPLASYTKTYELAKLNEIAQHSGPLLRLFDKVGFEIGGFTACIFWRAKIHNLVQESAVAAAEEMREGMPDLVSYFYAKAKGEKASMLDEAGQLQFDIACNCIGFIVSGMAADDCDVKAKRAIKSAMTDFLNVFTHFQLTSPYASLTEQVRILQAAVLIMNAALAESEPTAVPSRTDLQDAFSMLQETNAAKLRQVAFSGDVGQALLADAEMLLASNSIDEEANIDFLTGETLLQGDETPQRKKESNVLIGQANTFSGDCIAMRQVLDAWSHFEQALAAWSPVRKTQMLHSLGLQIKKVCDCVLFATAYAVVDTIASLTDPMNLWDRAFTDSWRVGDKIPNEILETCLPEPLDLSSCKRALISLEDSSTWCTTLSATDDTFRKTWGQLQEAITTFSRVQQCLSATWDIARGKLRVFKACEALNKCDIAVPPANHMQTLFDRFHEQASGEDNILADAFLITDKSQCFEGKAMQVAVFADVITDKPDGRYTLSLSPETNQNFAALVEHSPSSKLIKHIFVSSNVACVADKFWSYINLIHRHTAAAPTALQKKTSMAEALATLLPPSSTEPLVAALDDVLHDDMPPDSFGVTLDGLHAIGSARMLKKMIVMHKLTSIAMPPLEHNGVEMPTTYLLSLIDVYTTLYKFVTVLAWVSHRLAASERATPVKIENADGSPALACRNQEKLGACPLILEGLKIAHELFKKTSELEEHQAHMPPVEGATLCISLDDIEKLLVGAPIVLQRGGTDVIVKATGHLQVLADKCESSTPRWAHIVTDTTYHAKLAVRQLLQSPTRTTLGPHTATLSEGLEHFGYLFSVLQIEGKPDTHPQTKEVISYATGVCQAGSKTLAVMAAVSIIEEFKKSTDGATLAQKFLDNRKDMKLPEQLLKKLREMK